MREKNIFEVSGGFQNIKWFFKCFILSLSKWLQVNHIIFISFNRSGVKL